MIATLPPRRRAALERLVVDRLVGRFLREADARHRADLADPERRAGAVEDERAARRDLAELRRANGGRLPRGFVRREALAMIAEGWGDSAPDVAPSEPDPVYPPPRCDVEVAPLREPEPPRLPAAPPPREPEPPAPPPRCDVGGAAPEPAAEPAPPRERRFALPEPEGRAAPPRAPRPPTGPRVITDFGEVFGVAPAEPDGMGDDGLPIAARRGRWNDPSPF